MRPPRLDAHPTEKALTTQCMKRWRAPVAAGGYAGEVFHPVGAGAQTSGQPDLVGCMPVTLDGPAGPVQGFGRMVAVELKQPGKKPTPLQFKRLRDYAAAGALAGWATTEAEFCDLLGHADDPTWVNPQLLRDVP